MLKTTYTAETFFKLTAKYRAEGIQSLYCAKTKPERPTFTSELIVAVKCLKWYIEFFSALFLSVGLSFDNLLICDRPKKSYWSPVILFHLYILEISGSHYKFTFQKNPGRVYPFPALVLFFFFFHAKLNCTPL